MELQPNRLESLENSIQLLLQGQQYNIRTRHTEPYYIFHPNLETLKRYNNHLAANNISLQTRYSILLRIKLLSIHIKNIPFDAVERFELENYFSNGHFQEYSGYTKQTHKSNIKSFYKWLNNHEMHIRNSYPQIVNWIQARPKTNTKGHAIQDSGRTQDLTREDMITLSELERLINVCNTAEEKCIVAMAWDTGARPGELVNVKLHQITKVNGYHRIRFNQIRQPVLTVASPHLESWLAVHPRTGGQDSYLFIHTSGYFWYYQLLKRIVTRVGLNKPHTAIKPHLFRYSSVVYYKEQYHLSDAELKERYGWSPDSNMLGIYLKSNTDSGNNTIIQQFENGKNVCDNCGDNNPGGYVICDSCGGIL